MTRGWAMPGVTWRDFRDLPNAARAIVALAGLLAALALSACATRQAPAPEPSARARIAFTATRETRIDLAGLADPATGRRLTADDSVRIASISKLVVALGVMRLVEQGRLDLDAPVSATLGWPLAHPAFPERPVTLRLLLSHRAGLTDGIDYALPLGASLRAALADPKAWDAAHPPGAHYRYANLNFPVIASVMEAATGARFDRLMDTLVIRPLGLDACFNWAACSPAVAARAVVLTDPAGAPVRDDLHGRPPACPVVPAADGSCDLGRWRAGGNGALFSPQGGLRISIRDLGRIGRMLLGDGVLDGRRFLSSASIATLIGPEWVFDGGNGETGETVAGSICTYGLAVQTLATPRPGCRDDPFGDGVRRVGHAGDAYGLLSGLWVDRAAGTGVAYFLTAVPPDAPRAAGSSFAQVERDMATGRCCAASAAAKPFRPTAASPPPPAPTGRR